MARHCFEVHVALDIGDADPADVTNEVERVLNSRDVRDALVLLKHPLGPASDVTITVEDHWLTGSTGSTQPLVEDEDLVFRLERSIELADERRAERQGGGW